MTADRNDRAAKVHAAAVEVGLSLPKPYRSQNYTSLQRGYSIIHFDHRGAKARREGQGALGTLDIAIDYANAAWLEQCISILQSGRTVECGVGVNLRSLTEDRVHWHTADYPLHHLLRVVEDPDYPWELNPAYQRAHVWTDKQRRLFVGHLFDNGRVPLVFLQEWESARPYEVIDGKQRLTSCLMFLKGEIPAELSNERLLWYRDFDEIDRRACPTIKCGIVRLASQADVLRFYIKLNNGGTAHTDDEIDRVRALLAIEEKQ